MTTNATAHANCDHEVSPQARAACRKERRAAALAHSIRRHNVTHQLDRPFGSGNLLHRVCCRYQLAAWDAGTTPHAEHHTSGDCADSILAAIDYWKSRGDIVVPENDLERHAYRMFS